MTLLFRMKNIYTLGFPTQLVKSIVCLLSFRKFRTFRDIKFLDKNPETEVRKATQRESLRPPRPRVMWFHVKLRCFGKEPRLYHNQAKGDA